MADPITVFVLTTAAGVLSGMIRDLIRSGRKAALRKEIEYEVSRRLMQRQGLTSDQMRKLVREVMDEVNQLAIKDPKLTVSEEGVGLRKPVRHIVPLGKQKRVERTLNDHLQQLEKAVQSRRRELGLPLSPSEAEERTEAETAVLRKGAECREPQAMPNDEDSSGGSSESKMVLPEDRQLASLKWEAAKDIPSKSEWREQMEITRDRVRRRRDGEDLDD